MLERIVAWLLKPLALQPSSEAEHQARLAVMFALVGAAVGVCIAAFYALDMSWSVGSLVLSAGVVINISLPFVLRATRSVALSVNLFALSIWGVAAYIAWLRGGFPITSMVWLMFAPMITLKLLSPRNAFVWTGIVLATFWTFWGMNRLGPGLAPHLHKSAAQILDMEVCSLSLILVVFVTILYLHHRARQRLLRENDRLMRATEAAERLESLGRLAGGMCHDFNNLLAVILSHSEMALADADPQGEAASDLRAIREAASKGAGLTRQLLSFSRHPEQAGQVLDVNEALIALEPLLPTILGTQVELVTELDADLPRVHLNWSQLDRIVLNLLMNARDAMPNGGRVTLRTSVGRRDGPGADRTSPPVPVVQLTVSDTGTGMTEDVKAHLFEPFYTTKRDGTGTGLGLATVYGMVHSAGGSIAVASAVGLGTRVDILLPGTREPTERPETISTPRRSLRPGVALLVDDEPTVLLATARRLEGEGLSVLMAANGAEALKQLDEHGPRIDLLLTDVRMPKMDGPTLARSVRARYPDLPILLMSGMAASDVPRAPDELAFPLLDKPFTQEQLRAALRLVRPDSEAIADKP